MDKFLMNLKLVIIGSLFSTQVLSDSINWRSWGESAFQAAANQNKLVLLDVGTEWCSACNQMQHETYTDSKVQSFLNESFITIHVDAEAEPDIGERYGFWGWPALIFLAPNGDHVGFYRGFRPATDFITILDILQSNHQSGTLEKADIEVDLVSSPSADGFGSIVTLGNQMIDRFYDNENQSWGGARMADPYLFKQAWWRSKSTSQQQWTDNALKTSQLYLKLLDPVWGGVWFGTRSEKFDKDFIHEKRTEHQAGALSIFAQAYKHDKNTDWLNALDHIYSYLDDFLLAESGGYYTSQEMHIYNSNTSITPEDYFKLDNSQRRELGIPAIDKTIYTDINAKLVLAFAQAFEATGEEKWRKRALSLISYLNKTSDPSGQYSQIIGNDKSVDRARVLPEENNSIVFLRSQAYAGLANLAAFQISGKKNWLIQAHAIAEVTIDQLHDAASGGLLGSSRKTIGPDGNKLIDQPLIDNGAAADFFNQLSAYTYGQFDQIATYSSKQYREFAEQVLRAVAQPQRLRVQGNFIGQYVLALHQWHDEFAQVSVVCNDLESSACESLHMTALVELNHDRRIVKVQKPGFYPDRGEANLFICNSKTCSSPIAYDDTKLIDKANRWFGALAEQSVTALNSGSNSGVNFDK